MSDCSAVKKRWENVYEVVICWKDMKFEQPTFVTGILAKPTLSQQYLNLAMISVTKLARKLD